MKPAAWTEAHRREALRRTGETLWESFSARDKAPDSFGINVDVSSESEWRWAMGCLGFDPARIDREVRRVRALAESRLVRETSERFEVRRNDGDSYECDTWEDAREHARLDRDVERSHGDRGRLAHAVHVRVARIRRA